MVCVPKAYRHTSFLEKKKTRNALHRNKKKKAVGAEAKLKTMTGISVLFSGLLHVSSDCGNDVSTEWKLGYDDIR